MKLISESCDFWVPDSHAYKTGEECLEAWPSQAAVGCARAKTVLEVQNECDEIKAENERLESEYNKLCIFFEQLGDLSCCYDAQDVVNLGQARLNDLRESRRELREALRNVIRANQGEISVVDCMVIVRKALEADKERF